MSPQNHARRVFTAAAPGAETLRFGHFELDPAERVLRIRGEPANLGGRAFDLLLALAERAERLVTKQELLDRVWRGLVVEEHNVATQIGTLRKLLGAQAIATVPGRGYRLVARRVEPVAAPSLPARRPVARTFRWQWHRAAAPRFAGGGTPSKMNGS